MKTYTELSKLNTLEERFEYLKIGGEIGAATFGGSRELNQILYRRNPKWKFVRRNVIVRDRGGLLGLEKYPIRGPILVHHIEPITIEDVLKMDPKVFDEDNLICTSLPVHSGVHFGDSSCLPQDPIIRTINDTCPWK